MSNAPNQLLVEDVLESMPKPPGKQNPPYSNRGIPKPTYEPDLTSKEVLADPTWKASMNEEMESLLKKKTLELVNLSTGKKPVRCRWVYIVKYKANGTIERLKARLVAKGYTQTYGIDYMETFAPVPKINTIQVLLSLDANLDWPLQQFNVKNTLLHGDLLEEVYMDLPPNV
ncbi:unnamed protein product [Prunus armeniaca]